MSAYLAFPIMAIVAAVQASMGTHAVVLGVHPDLVLIVALAWGLVRGVGQGLIWMFAGALFLDLLYNGTFGFNVLAATPIALLALVPEANLIARGVLLPLAAMAAGSFFYNTALLLLLALTGAHFNLLEMLGSVVLPLTLVNTLLIPFLYWPLRGMRSWLTPVVRPALP